MIYIWKPIAINDDFISLGMLATTTEEPPALNDVRTIPYIWLKPINTNDTSQKPQKIWNDSGAGGRPGSIWVTSHLNLLYVKEGHGIPKEQFFQLHKKEFKANYRIKEINFNLLKKNHHLAKTIKDDHSLAWLKHAKQQDNVASIIKQQEEVLGSNEKEIFIQQQNDIKQQLQQQHLAQYQLIYQSSEQKVVSLAYYPQNHQFIPVYGHLLMNINLMVY